MQPYKRRRRTRRDMIVLGGWLFADLLLGLAMLFAVANTVGAPPPEPTPTPMPDYLATAEADIAQGELSAQQTVEAVEAEMDAQQAAAQATRDAEATRAAMSESERATADAQATNQAVAAQATIEALSTEQAENQSSQEQLNAELATSVAEATEVAAQIDAEATRQAEQADAQATEQAEVAAQIEAQGTEQAELAANATEQAESGVTAQGTMTALEEEIAQAESAQATLEAQSAAAQQQAADAQATADAQSAAAQQQITDAQATADAAQSQLSAAEQQVQLNSLNPTASTQTIQVDLDGVNEGDDEAVEEARAELESALGPYLQGNSCRIGFVNISSRAPTIGEGIALSNSIADLIESDFPQLLPEPAAEGEAPQLASESIALPNTSPEGEVSLQLFLSTGCQPAE